MYRIRFHGRGGQGMRTASRILGRALFDEGYQVQDAPRYGAERRGAPIFAYVRFGDYPINERGIIHRPGLVVVADPSLLAIPAAAVLQGCSKETILLIDSAQPLSSLLSPYDFKGGIIALPRAESGEEELFPGPACAGGAAALLGLISLSVLEAAAVKELSDLPTDIMKKNLKRMVQTFNDLQNHGVTIPKGLPVPASSYRHPAWISPTLEEKGPDIPAIIGSPTSHRMNTGSWRTKRPIIDHERCNRCWWICNTFCPDGAISLDENRYPHIDYDHCKGCLICMNQCPTGAISSAPEHPNITDDQEESA